MPTKSEFHVRASLEANASIRFSNSGAAYIGAQQLTTKLGGTTRVGKLFKQLAPTYDRSPDLFPFIKGTYTRGQTEYARRRTGEEVIVGTWRNGNLTPTRLGDTYYGQFRQEFILDIPVLRYPQLRGRGGRFITTGPPHIQMLPLSSLTLEGTAGIREYRSASRLRSIATVRHNEQAPVSREEKWQKILEAFTQYYESEKAVGDAKFDANGNLILIRGSDFYLAVEPETYEAAKEGESRGFRLSEMAPKNTPGIGLTHMEVLLHRPLGNLFPMPLNFIIN